MASDSKHLEYRTVVARTVVSEIVEFNGTTFRRYPQAKRPLERLYYRSPKPQRTLLHRVIWEYHYGAIPQGYHVHHKDENPLNNDIANLELLGNSEHIGLHSRNPGKQRSDLRAKNCSKIAHIGSLAIKNPPLRKFSCKCCGLEWEQKTWHARKACSASCRAKLRYQSGKSHISRCCVICGKEFWHFKGNDTQSCGKKCGAQLRKNIQHLKD